MSDYVSGLRQDLVEAAARQQAAGRGARVARPLRPRAWSPVVVLGTAAALVAALVLVVGLRAVTPPRPPEAPKVVGGFHIEAQPRDAVASGGYVIVADYGGQLLQIDPQTGERHQIETTADNALPAAVADDGGALWAVAVDARPARPRSTLLKLDPKSGRRLDSIPLAGEGGALAIGAGGIWLQTNRTSPEPSAPPRGLDRIDPVTHRRTAAIKGVAPQSIAASDHSLWTREGETVTQRDDAGRVVNRVRAHLARARARGPAVDRRGQRRRVGRRAVRGAPVPDRGRPGRQAAPRRRAGRRDRAHPLRRLGDGREATATTSSCASTPMPAR